MSLRKSDGTVVSDNVEFASSFIRKVVGVMFRKRLDKALIFDMGWETYDAVHMLFVRIPIDVVFLNKNREIVDIKTNLRPWTGSAFPCSRFRYVIELPAGTAEKFSLEKGGQLAW